VKGNIAHLSPEAHFKFELGPKGVGYIIDIFKNDVYGNGLLAVEYQLITI
jgi:hypothetical protein